MCCKHTENGTQDRKKCKNKQYDLATSKTLKEFLSTIHKTLPSSCYGTKQKQSIHEKGKRGIKSPNSITLHEYYTPKAIKIQASLAIFTIFVDYAQFYVNIIM